MGALNLMDIPGWEMAVHRQACVWFMGELNIDTP
jgi:hypothetical protein